MPVGSIATHVPRVAIDGDVRTLDTTHLGVPGMIAVFLVPVAGSRFVLVESGPGSTLATLESRIAEAGWRLDDIAAVLVTHVHLDHAGAAGALSRRYGVPVYVHENGSRHLADPSRLLASAARVFGAEMDSLWGSVEPVPASNLRPLKASDTICLAGRTFIAIESPGHARHHLSFLLDDGTLFVGDAAGVRLPDSGVIAPATPPPDVDLDAWNVTMARLAGLQPKIMMLTHFGAVTDAGAHFDGLRALHESLRNAVRAALGNGASDRALVHIAADSLRSRLAAERAPADTVTRYFAASPPAMSASGIKRFLSLV